MPVGAEVMRGGAVLGLGRNRPRALRDPTAHAEMLAIRAACAALGQERLEGCDLYVTLEPCAMCAGTIYWAGIGRVLYGAEESALRALTGSHPSAGDRPPREREGWVVSRLSTVPSLGAHGGPQPTPALA